MRNALNDIPDPTHFAFFALDSVANFAKLFGLAYGSFCQGLPQMVGTGRKGICYRYKCLFTIRLTHKLPDARSIATLRNTIAEMVP